MFWSSKWIYDNETRTDVITQILISSISNFVLMKKKPKEMSRSQNVWDCQNLFRQKVLEFWLSLSLYLFHTHAHTHSLTHTLYDTPNTLSPSLFEHIFGWKLKKMKFRSLRGWKQKICSSKKETAGLNLSQVKIKSKALPCWIRQFPSYTEINQHRANTWNF